MKKQDLKDIIDVCLFEINWLRNKNKKLNIANKELKKQLTLTDVVSSLFMLLDEDNEPVMPLVLDEQKAIETRLKYLKDGTRKAITINRVEVI